MGRQEIMAFDPGLATGVFWGWFDEATPLTRLGVWIVPNGAVGLSDFLKAHSFRPDHVVSERFVPDGTPGSRETVSPQGEGVLIHEFGKVNWQLRGEKALGYDSQKQSDELLKRLGWWVTGKDVDHTDGRDALDSEIHAIQYMRKLKHVPTLSMIYGPPD